MASTILEAARASRAPLATAEQRGYHVMFHSGQKNICPGCGYSHWYVGRMTAECAFCTTALPIKAATACGPGVFRTRRKDQGEAEWAA